MKFYISEQNIGKDTTKEMAEKVIKLLAAKGWDVEYGTKENKATEVSEFGKEQQLTDLFSDDFMACVDEVESQD